MVAVPTSFCFYSGASSILNSVCLRSWGLGQMSLRSRTSKFSVKSKRYSNLGGGLRKH